MDVGGLYMVDAGVDFLSVDFDRQMDQSLNVTECNFVVDVVDCGVAANVLVERKSFGSSPFLKKKKKKRRKKEWSKSNA